jgi:ubiquinone/menaquinone biosynthesis C-methylase UbiE
MSADLGGAAVAGMPGIDEKWLDTCPARLRGPLARFVAGDLPTPATLMQLVIDAVTPDEVRTALDAALAAVEGRPDARATADRLRELAQTWLDHRHAWPTLKAVLAEAVHDVRAATPEQGIANWKTVFDHAARISPEASVALYSLADPALLTAATAEIVNRIGEWGLLRRQDGLLEIGCGIGRFQASLASEAGLLIGIDISEAMLDLARRRCAGLANVLFLRSSGRDLSFIRDGAVDLVLAVDAFPYLVQPRMELAARHVLEAGRVLNPGGNLLILNFSYRGALDQDRQDVAGLAAQAGLEVLRNGTRAFSLWDGVAFQLRKGDGAVRENERNLKRTKQRERQDQTAVAEAETKGRARKKNATQQKTATRARKAAGRNATAAGTKAKTNGRKTASRAGNRSGRRSRVAPRSHISKTC